MSIGKKKFVFVMGGLFFLIVILSIALICIYNPKKEILLDQVYLQNNDKNSNFAIMVQNSDGSGYQQSDSFPVGMIFNTSLSGCVDGNGDVLNNSLQYNSSLNIINVKSKGSAYCYLYFDRVTSFGEYLIGNDVSGLQKTLVGTDTLYRFSGTSGNTGIDNYVCIGSTSCVSGDDNMYRIIGVDPGTKIVKVIKQTKYNSLEWNDENNEDTWEQSSLYSVMNSTWYENISYSEMITQHSWGVNPVSTLPATRAELYSGENSLTINANVGILSLTDYYMAYGGDQSWMSTYDNYTNNWIHISNNSTNELEWMMSIYTTSTPGPWFVFDTGQTSKYYNAYELHAVRPTFYLKATVKRKSGSGTIDDPFIIEYSGPTNNSVLINSGSAYTTSTNVTLKLSSSGATQMCISNSSNCTSWETYSESKSWTLSTGDGTKTVYVWFRDDSGNTTNYVSDAITLDTVAPTVTATASNNNTVNAQVHYSSSEVGEYCINTSSTVTNMSNCVVNSSLPLANTTYGPIRGVITDSGTYYVHVKDAAGNIGVSSAVSLTKIKSFGEYLMSTKPTGLNTTTAYDDMYRFIGTSVNNYVKMGGVMYRIIGVTSEANNTEGLEKMQVKLIKADSLSSTRAFNTDYNSNITWPNSELYTYLQSSSVLGASGIIPSAWTSKIDSIKWRIGDIGTNNIQNAEYVSGLEDNTLTSSTSKVGLMYLSDYLYSITAGGTESCAQTACSSWMVTGNPQWTMTRYGYDSTNEWYAGFVSDYTDGKVAYGYLGYTAYVRPTFYLIYDVVRTGGSGTIDDPFLLDNESATTSAGEYLLNNPTTGLNTSMEGGMYRYQGTTANNYVCFGTSTKSTCTGNTDTYMYRIIGIKSNGQMKLIKNTSIGELPWNEAEATYSTTWATSDIYSDINGASYLENTTYVPSGWSSKIATTSWKHGGYDGSSLSAGSMYSTENSFTSTVSAKIALMYIHDYSYAYQSGGLNCAYMASGSTCAKSWMFYGSEWTMTLNTYDSSSPSPVYIYSGGLQPGNTGNMGYAGNYEYYSEHVRPVFYLNSDVEIISGSGTSSDPFIIQ